MGLIVSVLKADGEREERTLVGVTAELAEIVGSFRGGPFEPNEKRPAIILGVGPTMRELNVVAYDAIENGNEWTKVRRAGMNGPMANGRFIWSGDGRFPVNHPVRYFDRWE